MTRSIKEEIKELFGVEPDGIYHYPVPIAGITGKVSGGVTTSWGTAETMNHETVLASESWSALLHLRGVENAELRKIFDDYRSKYGPGALDELIVNICNPSYSGPYDWLRTVRAFAAQYGVAWLGEDAERVINNRADVINRTAAEWDNKTGLADVPEYRGRVIHCQGEEDGDI